MSLECCRAMSWSCWFHWSPLNPPSCHSLLPALNLLVRSKHRIPNYSLVPFPAEIALFLCLMSKSTFYSRSPTVITRLVKFGTFFLLWLWSWSSNCWLSCAEAFCSSISSGLLSFLSYLYASASSNLCFSVFCWLAIFWITRFLPVADYWLIWETGTLLSVVLAGI